MTTERESLLGAQQRAADAEKTLAVMFEVLPAMITEAAQDFLQAYLDGREPDISEEKIAERMYRIVGEKFGAPS